MSSLDPQFMTQVVLFMTNELILIYSWLSPPLIQKVTDRLIDNENSPDVNFSLLQCFILTTSSALLSSSPVLGMYISVVSGHLRDGLQLRFGLGLQQRLLVLSLLLHPAVGLPLTQTLGVGGVELLDSVAAAVQPAGGRLLHHQGQPGRGERQHVQEHPGEVISTIF